MTRFIFVLVILISFESKSQEFEFIPVRKGLDTTHLKKGTKIIRDQGVKKISYLTPEKRDVILNKYLPEEMNKLDLFERDILYKSILNYDDKTLVEKYPFLREINLKKLKNDLL
jgi:hypothetical protein